MTKRQSTADKLLSFRERLASHYAAVRKGSVTPKPNVNEFEGYSRFMAQDIETSELTKHNAAVAADERFRKLGYKTTI